MAACGCARQLHPVRSRQLVCAVETNTRDEPLATTKFAFGRAVQALRFRRHTRAAKLLWSPLPDGWESGAAGSGSSGALQIPSALIGHRAMLLLSDRHLFQRGRGDIHAECPGISRAFAALSNTRHGSLDENASVPQGWGTGGRGPRHSWTEPEDPIDHSIHVAQRAGKSTTGKLAYRIDESPLRSGQ
jgi:hypothetical protein